ncbi:hypothetical protein [Thalassomonas actiniarum]|uniref:Uncharacterized protein n=1 Tax=Thalassomonas actiniarum TaxID=485447 RepID=A0AAF0C4C2_9GAMM|nr:hypothetical protein [Thalassomonas actiniarum]WDD99850.1 hypothetical protein SG35_004045 [Thalassomonas actiniarum]
MKLQQVSNAALLGVALSVTGSQVAAFEKLVAEQPVKTIEQDEDYGKNNNLKGWGWNQGGEALVDGNKKQRELGIQSVVDTTDGGGSQTQTITPPAEVPEIKYFEKNSFFYDESLNELSLAIGSDDSIEGGIYQVRVNEDGRGWRDVAQVPSSRFAEVDITVSAQKSVEMAVRPCLQSDSATDSTVDLNAECGDAVSAGISYKVPDRARLGWTDVIEMQLPTYAPNARITGVDQLLEKGYDMVRDGMNISAHCFVTPPGENHTSVPRYSTEQDFQLIKSHQMAINVLDISNTLQGSITFNGIDSRDNKYKHSIYQQAMKTTDKTLYVGKFRHVNQELVSRPSSQLSLLDNYQQMLINGSKENFRSACGDKYVSSLELGKEIYYYIRILSEEGHIYNKEERESRFGVLFKELISLNFDGTKKATLLAEFSNYEFEIKSVSAGAGAASAIKAHNSLEEFLASLEQFSDVNDNTANYTAIGMKTQDYPVPEALINKPFNEVFLDYPTILGKIEDWSLFNDQVEKRCEIYGSSAEYVTEAGMKINNEVAKLNLDGVKRTQYDLCGMVRSTIAKEYSHCLDDRMWGSCLAGPRDGRCMIGSQNCNDYAVNINVWTPVTASKTLNVYKGDCAATTDCVETFWQQACLTSPSHVLDYRVNYGLNLVDVFDRVADGVSVNEQRLWYVNSLVTEQFKSNNLQCARLSATLVSKAWRQNTSEYIGEVTIHGLEFIPNMNYQ